MWEQPGCNRLQVEEVEVTPPFWGVCSVKLSQLGAKLLQDSHKFNILTDKVRLKLVAHRVTEPTVTPKARLATSLWGLKWYSNPEGNSFQPDCFILSSMLNLWLY